MMSGWPNLAKDLPELVLVAILGRLDRASLCALGQTNRYMHSLASTSSSAAPRHTPECMGNFLAAQLSIEIRSC